MGSFSSIGERLRAARLERGVSLEDIASASRINLKFLKDIEEGIEPNVPRTYLRAFVKAYAERVNIDVDDILRQMQMPEGGSPTVSASASPASPSMAIPASSSQTSLPVQVHNTQSSQKQIKPLLTLVVILLAGLILYVVWLRSDRNERSVQEISFNDVVKEHEAKMQGAKPSLDSSAQVLAGKNQPAKFDSLDLEAVASESVWVHLVVDQGSPKEYMMTKFSHLHWKGKSSFLLSLGNPAGISLTLNGQKVEIPRKDNAPVKNMTLSRETLQKLQHAPQKKEN
jgi:cytoskeletal protein RodZ